MYFVFHSLESLFAWLSANGAGRATTLLLFVTAWYVVLTSRMTKAISTQTRAMLQPELTLSVNWNGEAYGPIGSFVIKNDSSHPIIVLDAFCSCVAGKVPFTRTYEGLDEYVIAPGRSLEPVFDFKRRWIESGVQDATGGFEICVVACDLGRAIHLEYRLWPVLGIRTCRLRYPPRVRLRYMKRNIAWKYRSAKCWLNLETRRGEARPFFLAGPRSLLTHQL